MYFHLTILFLCSERKEVLAEGKRRVRKGREGQASHRFLPLPEDVVR